MAITDYKDLPPLKGEDASKYCRRLEQMEHEEMFIRKALMFHFDMHVAQFGHFFNDYQRARLRHVKEIFRASSNRNDYSAIRKISKNLGISNDDAARWLERYKQVGTDL